jgi:polysaccharide biosynthesis protein PslG
MAERYYRLRGIAAALILVGVLAGSAAGAVSAEAARGSASAGKGRARVKSVASLRSFASRRLIARTRRRLEARPSSQPLRSPLLPPPVAAPPSLGASGGFGVSLDNAEYLDAATRDRELDSMAAMGADWVRFDVKWSDVQWDGPASFNWSKYDPLVDSARARGLSVLANLAYSPTWARPGRTTDKFGPDTDERRHAYAAFTEAAVRHFAGRVSHWELWNEPNMSMFWTPRPNAAHYAALIRDAYGRMKAAGPGAYVLAGATSPADSNGTRIDEVAFISAVYANGGRGRFDGWSHHPYTVDPSFAHPQNAWWQMAGTSPSIRSVMAANGDGAKQLWGTEFGPPTSGAPNAMSEPAQAAQITEAYTTWNAYGWSGPLFVYTQRDKRSYGASTDSFDYYGMLRHDFSPKPVWSAYRALAT